MLFDNSFEIYLFKIWFSVHRPFSEDVRVVLRRLAIGITKMRGWVLNIYLYTFYCEILIFLLIWQDARLMAWIILCMGLANERRHCNVTSSLIGWAHTDNYRQTSNISRTLVGNGIVDHLSALFQLLLHSRLNTWLQWIGQRQLQDETRDFRCRGLVRLILEVWRYSSMRSTKLISSVSWLFSARRFEWHKR